MRPLLGLGLGLHHRIRVGLARSGAQRKQCYGHVQYRALRILKARTTVQGSNCLRFCLPVVRRSRGNVCGSRFGKSGRQWVIATWVADARAAGAAQQNLLRRLRSESAPWASPHKQFPCSRPAIAAIDVIRRAAIMIIMLAGVSTLLGSTYMPKITAAFALVLMYT